MHLEAGSTGFLLATEKEGDRGIKAPLTILARVTGGTWKDGEADLYHTHSLWGTVPKTSQLTHER